MTTTILLTQIMKRVPAVSNWLSEYRMLMLVLLLCTVSISAFSQEDDSKSSPNPFVNLWHQQSLTGDWGSARTRLAEQWGISLTGFWDNSYYADPIVGNTQG
jgi:hypothetical protein